LFILFIASVSEYNYVRMTLKYLSISRFGTWQSKENYRFQ